MHTSPMVELLVLGVGCERFVVFYERLIVVLDLFSPCLSLPVKQIE
jgi:hypothetical protein